MMDSSVENIPKLIVFDLDYTLWPFWVDTHVSPPFHKDHSGQVCDSVGTKIKLYPDVMDILNELKERKITLGVASRTGATYDARALLKLLQICDYFSFKQIYPGSKIKHFRKFKEDSGLKYSDMLFFDDEPRNIKDVSELGVTCILARDGLSRTCFANGLQRFSDNANKNVKKQKTLTEYFHGNKGKGEV